MTTSHPRRRGAGMRGSSVLYAVVLSPVLVLVLAMATDLGALQLDRDHLRSAVDQAVLAGADAAATGGSGLDVDVSLADQAVRRSLVDNLRPLESAMAGTSSAAVAAAADVVVVTEVPAADPFDASVTLRRPSVVARVRVPVSSGLLHLAGVPATVVVTLSASADLRVTGRGST